MDKQVLLGNIDSIHTTEMGKERIIKNLNLTVDPVLFCKEVVMNPTANIYKEGKNWYVILDDIKITINSYSYTIITAHLLKK